MSPEEVARLLHHPNTSLPDIRPCDTANASDTKVHWTSEEIHRIMGCRKFRNYKHILDVSKDGAWMDGGEFPMSLGSYATIPKAKRGQPLDRTVYRYLDAVHMDIALVIVFPWEVTILPSSWWIVPPVTIGPLD